MKLPRKVHIKSYGCQMNVYDAQRMVDTLAGEGFVETASVDDADLVILNTCHIREKACQHFFRRDRVAVTGQGLGMGTTRDDFAVDQHAVAIENDEIEMVQSWCCGQDLSSSSGTQYNSRR